MKAVLDQQRQHWENTFLSKPRFFGEIPSEPARKAADLFKREGKTKILELGAGQGRDTIFFAQNGFEIYALDYSETGVRAVTQKAEALGLAGLITAIRHDVRERLPFADEYFDACYSHMLYCMAFTTTELGSLSEEVRRVLKPGGLNIYTARHTGDPDYRTGIHRGEDMYEVGGFIVHFFSGEKVRHLAKGYEVVEIDEFGEGKLPRKLFRVTLRKQGAK